MNGEREGAISHLPHMKYEYEAAQSCPTLCNPMGFSMELSMEFSRQEYWSG